MYNIFDYHEDATLFTFGHNRLGQGVIEQQGNGELMNVVQPYPSGVESNDDSCIILPFPIDHGTNPEDREMLIDMLPTRRSDDSGNNDEELDQELTDLQSSLNLRAHNYNQYCMRCHTPPTINHTGNMLLRVTYRTYDSDEFMRRLSDDDCTLSASVAGAEPQSVNESITGGGGSVPSGDNVSSGHAKAMNSARFRSRQIDATVEFEWDSDSSHHFTGSLQHYIVDSFVQKRMRVYVADGKGCWAEGYGSFPHPMLQKVWYVPQFKGRPNLFSDIVAMGEGYNCERINQSLQYFQGDDPVLTGVFRRNRWILSFKLSNTDGVTYTPPTTNDDTTQRVSAEADTVFVGTSLNGIHETAHAHGTGMGLLPIPVQTILMHRRCNHVGPAVLHTAVSKNLTSGLCAAKGSASLALLNALECLACTLAKSHYASHVRRHPEFLRLGIERQRVPGHLVPRGVHGGISPYDFFGN
jgi:hypothetical protein